jgi:hypothetical protein
VRPDPADVDAALPIELDSDTRALATEDASIEQQRLSSVSGGRSDLPDFFTKALTGSIVNSVTIHRLPSEESLGFSHEDLAVFRYGSFFLSSHDELEGALNQSNKR